MSDKCLKFQFTKWMFFSSKICQKNLHFGLFIFKGFVLFSLNVSCFFIKEWFKIKNNKKKRQDDSLKWWTFLHLAENFAFLMETYLPVWVNVNIHTFLANNILGGLFTLSIPISFQFDFSNISSPFQHFFAIFSLFFIFYL